MISLSELPTIDEVWDALPDRLKANPAAMERIKQSSPMLAAAIDKAPFWKPNPNNRGLRHARPDEQRLALMVSLYRHQGSQDPAGELAFWERIFAS